MASERNIMPECEEALDNVALRQGDIFEWLATHPPDRWRKYGIVITANCDLTQNKTRGVLSYLPILSMHDFVWDFWVPKKFTPVLQDYEKRVTVRINRQRERFRPDVAELSQQAVLDWVDRVGAGGITESLGIADKGLQNDIGRFLAEYDAIRKLLSNHGDDFDLLRHCYKLKNPQVTDHELYTVIADEMRKEVASLPDDIFPLCDLTENLRNGFFVMLRIVSQCKLNDVAVSVAELKDGGAQARRIARLKSPYVYALTQRLTRVFSDIGLPAEFDAKRLTMPERFFAALAERGKK